MRRRAPRGAAQVPPGTARVPPGTAHLPSGTAGHRAGQRGYRRAQRGYRGAAQVTPARADQGRAGHRTPHRDPAGEEEPGCQRGGELGQLRAWFFSPKSNSEVGGMKGSAAAPAGAPGWRRFGVGQVNAPCGPSRTARQLPLSLHPCFPLPAGSRSVSCSLLSVRPETGHERGVSRLSLETERCVY